MLHMSVPHDDPQKGKDMVYVDGATVPGGTITAPFASSSKKSRIFDIYLIVALVFLIASLLITLWQFFDMQSKPSDDGASAWGVIGFVFIFVIPSFIATFGVLVHNCIRTWRARSKASAPTA